LGSEATVSARPSSKSRSSAQLWTCPGGIPPALR
jgi:hypothetical protein